MHNISRTKEKNHITISIDAENKFNKIEHLFDTNSLSKLGTKGIFNCTRISTKINIQLISN